MRIITRSACMIISCLISNVASSPAMASIPTTSGLHVTDCSQAKGEDVVRWGSRPTEPRLLVVLSFLNRERLTIAQECFVADGPQADQSIITRSLLSSDILASYKSVSCEIRLMSDATSVSLTSGSSCTSNDVMHVDSGPIVEVRQGVVYRSGVRLYLSATFRDFFAQGLSDMTGFGVFESDGSSSSRSEVELAGLDPQAVILGFAGLRPGQHDIIFGTSDGPDQTILGHECYSDASLAAI